ncbi:MAG: sodium-dependent transporter [Candidatus Amulumruptor caecigallinarius]|nr:sodium-dependent transporter [Candidatus Amulumruptor caecigallinarius]MCM1397501.1 sodium-dependent transporter [Candidatus Amulumruptor caecigallinarius]MCM1454403.1 sodium-dependent transporter [bacterium]
MDNSSNNNSGTGLKPEGTPGRGSGRAQFATRLGVIATTVGSAVGLGNIWRFPYEAGVHGGGAFMAIYLFFIFVVGVPVVTAEFIIGRSSGANVYGAFKALHSHPFWRVVGGVGILASLMILSFYSVVAGWTLDYIFRSLQSFGGESTPAQLHAGFTAFSGSWAAVGWTVGFLLLNFLILRRGVQQGIEKVSNVMMPLLFIILLVFCANSLLLPGASRGLAFLFKPDFSQVDAGVMIGAMGQAFFSLSLGLGCLITYSSYFNRQTDLLRSATVMAGLDTLVAILAGVMIFPAVFTFGGAPEAGPRLVFETLPSLFMGMPWGMVWSTLFFVLLAIASLTSTISMSEISIAYFTEELGMGRTKATSLNTLIAVVFGTLCSLSFGPLRDVTVCGMTVFDLFDYVSSNILLPVGGMLISIFAGWVMDRRTRESELVMTTPWRRAIVTVVVWCMRVVAPACILLVFLSGLKLI